MLNMLVMNPICLAKAAVIEPDNHRSSTERSGGGHGHGVISSPCSRFVHMSSALVYVSYLSYDSMNVHILMTFILKQFKDLTKKAGTVMKLLHH